MTCSASIGRRLGAHLAGGSLMALAVTLTSFMAGTAQAQVAAQTRSKPDVEAPADSIQSDASDASLPAQNADAQQSTASGDIVVTGSRIARSGFTAPTPTTVLNSADIAKTGSTNIGQLATQIPAFQVSVNASTTTTLSATVGQSYLNLRGLGPSRTLVLVNSRRFVPTSSSAAVDVNVVPSSLVERLEVVTGGASAAYGSDAVAGVVNVIMKKELDGLVADATSGITTYGDNETFKGSVGWGTSFAQNRGHFLIAVEGERIGGIRFQSDRPWANRAFGLTVDPTFGQPGGGAYKFVILPDQQFVNETLGGLITSGVLRGTDFVTGSQTQPFQYGRFVGPSFQVGGSGLSASRYSPLVVPTQRYSIYSAGDYAVSDGIGFFYEASYSYSDGNNKNLIAPFNPGNLVIQRDNAFLPAGLATQLANAGQTSFNFGRYSVDLGFIGAENRNRTTRVVAGFKGALGRSLKWEVYGEYGHTFYRQILADNLISARFRNSVDAVLVNGQPVCRINAVTVTDPACVPVNLFGVGSPSQQAINYFTADTDFAQKIDQRVLSASLTGDLFRLNNKPVSFATGVEYREESTSAVTDPISRAGAFILGNPQPLAGRFNVKEGFLEVSVPVIGNLPLIRSIDIDGAVRATDYSTSGTVYTWKAGANWQVDNNIRLRFTRSRDIRAPNLNDLFTSRNQLVATVSDPLRGGSQTLILRFTSGNPALEPEVASTLTGGVVLTPSFAPGLRVSVDYYDIKISNAIATLDPQTIINRCAAGETELCAFVNRNAGGVLTDVTVSGVNVAQQATRGIDFEAQYRLPLSALGLRSGGTVTLSGLANYVDRLTTGAGGINLAGDVGGNKTGTSIFGLPHWQFNGSITYDNGPLTLWVQDRYVGGGKYDVTFGPNDLQNNHIDGRNYINASVTWRIQEGGRRKMELFGNINNVFNKAPPINPSTFFAPNQTNAVLYDVVGRMIRIGARVAF